MDLCSYFILEMQEMFEIFLHHVTVTEFNKLCGRRRVRPTRYAVQ